MKQSSGQTSPCNSHKTSCPKKPAIKAAITAAAAIPATTPTVTPTTVVRGLAKLVLVNKQTGGKISHEAFLPTGARNVYMQTSYILVTAVNRTAVVIVTIALLRTQYTIGLSIGAWIRANACRIKTIGSLDTNKFIVHALPTRLNTSTTCIQVAGIRIGAILEAHANRTTLA